ncbi:MAG: sensor histidine kinase [Solirubrobacterales bacterium]
MRRRGCDPPGAATKGAHPAAEGDTSGGNGPRSPWGGHRKRPPARMMWRFGGMFAAFLLVTGGILAAGVWALLTALGVGSASTALRLVAVGVLVLGVAALIALGRIARRSAAPVGALIEATARIEEGDYTARVPERGPRELRRLSRTFNGMSARLELVDAGRRAFLADVAHELRTPLTVIRGRVEAMLDGVDPRDDAELERVLRQAQVLERLVDDVRTVALAETGSLELRREPTDAQLLLNDVASDYREDARASGVELEVVVDDAVPLIVVDPARARQVVVNLLANAIRHAGSGEGIVLGASAEDGIVTLSVVDTGPGIDPELLGRAFERFAKGEESEGAGLGLAIAKDIVEAHGGSIAAESEVGAGTTVTVAFPAAA